MSEVTEERKLRLKDGSEFVITLTPEFLEVVKQRYNSSVVTDNMLLNYFYDAVESAVNKAENCSKM